MQTYKTSDEKLRGQYNGLSIERCHKRSVLNALKKEVGWRSCSSMVTGAKIDKLILINNLIRLRPLPKLEGSLALCKERVGTHAEPPVVTSALTINTSCKFMAPAGFTELLVFIY